MGSDGASSNGRTADFGSVYRGSNPCAPIYYSGIGSRDTPPSIQHEMMIVGNWAKINKYIIRSGHADGADYAFEQGAREACEVFLPWKTFNSQLPMLGKPIVVDQTPELDELVKRHHPIFKQFMPRGEKEIPPGVPYHYPMTRGAFALHRRNGCQVLGIKLDLPSKAVICWRTKSGGTDQAIRIAEAHNIPIINMAMAEFSTADKVLNKLEGL